MERFLSILLVFTMGVGVMTGCSGDSVEMPDVSATDVGEHIGQAESLDDMKQGDLAKLTKLYDLEEEVVDDFVLYTSTSNVRADELIVLKVKDASKVDGVLDSIQKRIEAQTIKFQDYRPEEYYLIEKHVLKTKGRLILFAVSEDADRMGKAFEEVLR